MFVDERVVKLKSGNGGDGCIAFRREKYIPMGGPNGGDGGRGGDVILECAANLNDLTPYLYKTNWAAQNAEMGRGTDEHGANGGHCVLKVPPGTVVYDVETGRQITEMTNIGDRVTLLKGGKGGLGNVHFKSATNQAPREKTLGELTEEKAFKFVLKTVANVGLVGYPNAGKSSLTRLLTAARPKTGAYPFTTKDPNVGIIDYPDTFERLTLADVPGLIEGASENKGLGHRFLRHIERCQLLIILIDTAGVDDRDPLKDYSSLLKELENYDPMLIKKPRLLVANKVDLEESANNLKRFEKELGQKIRRISCLSAEGIDELKEDLLKQYKLIS